MPRRTASTWRDGGGSSGASRATLNPVIAGAAMALSSVSVVANSLRLRRFRQNGAGMDQETFAAVDAFVDRRQSSADDASLRAALKDAAAAAGLPAIQVSPPQGRLLQILARSIGRRDGPRVRDPRRLQHDPAGAGAARGRQADHPGGEAGVRRGRPRQHRAGGPGGARRHPGRARRWRRCRRSTRRASGRSTSPSSTPTRSIRPNYFAWALDHSGPGSLIVADNVVRGGTLAESARGPGHPGPAPPARDARHRAAGLRRRRSRPWAARGTTASRSPWSR